MKRSAENRRKIKKDKIEQGLKERKEKKLKERKEEGKRGK